MYNFYRFYHAKDRVEIELNEINCLKDEKLFVVVDESFAIDKINAIKKEITLDKKDRAVFKKPESFICVKNLNENIDNTLFKSKDNGYTNIVITNKTTVDFDNCVDFYVIM